MQGVSFCIKEHLFSRIACGKLPFSRGTLSQGLVLAIALLQGQSFCKDCVPGCPFLKGHPLPRISSTHPLFKGCPLSRTIVSLLKGWQLPLSQGAPLMLHPPFCKGCPFSRIIPGSHPFPKGCSFPKELSFCKDSKAKLHNWGPADVGHPVHLFCAAGLFCKSFSQYLDQG